MNRYASLCSVLAVFIFGCGGSGSGVPVNSTPLTRAVVLNRTGFDHVLPQGGGDSIIAGRAFTASGETRAVLWSDASPEPIDLHPSGYLQSMAAAADGSNTVGDVFDGSKWAAAVWNGSSNSPTIIHPASGYASTHALGIAGSRIVGMGYENVTERRALVWDGINSTPRSLHDDELFSETIANETDGVNVVGGGWRGGNQGFNSAIVWKGPGLVLTNLHPKETMMRNTYANAVSGNTVVGEGQLGNEFHALAWRGTASSMVDLHPSSGYLSTYAIAVRGSTIVGSGWTGFTGDRALLWNGLNNQPVNLHDLLAGHPLAFTSSEATDILENGDVVGSAVSADGKTYAVRWTR